MIEVLKSEMCKVANALSQALEGYSFVIIGLQGDLGAGKTTFVKNFAKACGIEDRVSSPTYSIENEYISDVRNLKIRHVDCYRGLHPSDIEQILTKHENDTTEIVFIEWIDLLKIMPPAPYINLSIVIPEKDYMDKRYFDFTGDPRIVENFQQKYLKNA